MDQKEYASTKFMQLTKKGQYDKALDWVKKYAKDPDSEWLHWCVFRYKDLCIMYCDRHDYSMANRCQRLTEETYIKIGETSSQPFYIIAPCQAMSYIIKTHVNDENFPTNLQNS